MQRRPIIDTAIPRLCAGLTALSLFGCAGHAERTRTARDALSHGEPAVALQAINSELQVSSEKQLPEDPGGDNSILLLDRALILQQLEEYELSSRDLEVADKQVEMLDFSRSTADEISRYVFSDDSGPYRAPPYEKLMVNTMNMFNYVLRGDLSGGRVEARRFAVMQKYLKENDGSGAELLGPGSYVAGFIFEKSNDPEAALRYYDEALQFGEFNSLEPAIVELARRSSYRTPRLTKLLENASTGTTPAATPPETEPAAEEAAPADPDNVSRGYAPGGAAFLGSPGVAKAAQNEPPSAEPPKVEAAHALGSETEALEAVQPSETATDTQATDTQATDTQATDTQATDTQATDTQATDTQATEEAAAELLVVINFGRVPAKEAKRVAIGVALAEADRQMDPDKRRQALALSKRGLLTWINYPSLPAPRGPYSTPKAAVGSDAVTLDLIPVDELTVSAWKKTRGAMITSAITRMITRALAGEIVESSSRSVWAKLLSFSLQAGMTAADTPDTRSWATLPARIALGRIKVPTGKHTVVLSVSGTTVKHDVDLKPGQWDAIGLTVLKQN